MANVPTDLYQSTVTDQGSRSSDSYQPKRVGGSSTIEISQTSDLGAVEDTKQVLMKDLEANQEKTSEVNWLGSSYSGQDIKVVAHLYGSTKESISPKEKSLEFELAFHDAIITGGSNLLGSVGSLPNDSFDNRRKAFDAASGLINGAEPDQRALGEYRAQILFQGDLGSAIGISIARIKIQQMIDYSLQAKESVRQELERFSKVRDASSSTISLGSLQTISVQSHREKFGVRALGHSYVKGYTRGPRTVAGSMIFTIFNEHPLKRLIMAMGSAESIWRDPEITTLLPDQLPPIDLTIVFANEYGSLSRMGIYGVEFLNDGVTYSVDDLLSETIMNFVARDVDVLTKAGQVRLSRLQRGVADDSDDSASRLIFGNEAYESYLDTLKIRRRLVNR